MTLTEYLNQTDPVRMPKVILNHGEYSIGCTMRLAGHDDITQVFIQSPEFNKAFPGMTNEYVMKGNCNRLYTQDGEGNPKSLSCFYLPEIDFKITKGNHSPFDSDSCLEWGIYCMNTGHNPNTPIEIKPSEFLKAINNNTEPA